MATHREHAAFAAIALAVIGGIACQMLRADAATLPRHPHAVVKTVAPLAGAALRQG